MIKTYSIAEARDHFTELVRAVEAENTIQLTRRGKLVAILLSPDEYDRLQDKRVGFWDAYTEFRNHLDQQALDLAPEEVFADVRDQTPGREATW
ncbi:MAG: type II toxin-antitoxin system Phd/YefM family antitoxin [Caldilinea sp. CFX5]|nr:type II toxin-antitoxin system Phd/YefM family antitoxin [Caldilinea sp. CFX5]